MSIKIDTYLTQIRNLCRTRGLQIWNKQSLADLIYQDLLFIYHVPRLCREKILTVEHTEISFAQMALLNTAELINDAFHRLWTELQKSEVKLLFELREFAMFSIEKNAKTKHKYLALLKDIVMYSATVKLQTYDSNAGFTYFKKGLNKGTAKIFGQFYTPQCIQKSIVDELDPKSTDIVLDPSCGSCAFIQESVAYIIKNEQLEPKKALENMRGFEIEPNIYTEGIMNLFINFGILPDMKNNICEADALIVLLNSHIQVDKILANPPFGADATTFFEHYFNTETVIKGKGEKTVNPENKLVIPYTNTKESAILFFQIIIQKLKHGGKAGVVMNGSIFNATYCDLIHWFLDTCNLEKIIINPKGTFKEQGTNIETYSFIFTKGTKTSDVIISILGQDSPLRTLNYDEIKQTGWNIKLKGQFHVTNTTNTMQSPYEMVNLDKILQHHIVKKPISVKDSCKKQGLYALYSSSRDYIHCNEAEFKKESGPYLIQGSRGTISEATHYCDADFSVSNNVFVFTSKDSKRANLKYVYYWLRLSQIAKQISENVVIPMITKTMFNDIQISLPKIYIQDQIVKTLENNHDYITELATFTNKAMELLLKDPSGKTLESIFMGLQIKRNYLQNANSIQTHMELFINSMTNNSDKFTVNSVCKHKNGTTLKNGEKIKDGIYDVMGGGMDYVGKYDRFNCEGYTITISKSGASSGFVKQHNKRFWAGDCLSIEPQNSHILLPTYLYYILKLNPTITTSKITGSTIPHCKWSDICDTTIPVPPPHLQETIIDTLKEMESEKMYSLLMAKNTEERTDLILTHITKVMAPDVRQLI